MLGSMDLILSSSLGAVTFFAIRGVDTSPLPNVLVVGVVVFFFFYFSHAYHLFSFSLSKEDGIINRSKTQNNPRVFKCHDPLSLSFFYDPNIGEVEGAYWFGPVPPSVRPSVCP